MKNMVKTAFPHRNHRRGGFICGYVIAILSIFYSRFLGGISYATEDLFAAGVIALMVCISTLLNFVQEARSTKAADALKAMVSNTATVLRVINENGENGWLELPIDQLVPGDIIKLAAGDMVPADLRIIQARDLFVAQASLTGESLPVEKVATTREPRQKQSA
ncbi:magnesium-transporting ATPase MgtA [Salmonella enterica subsp. arizonae]|uniref:Magnesium-transporting ATPase MgtA n=1 Tax=Salmonella enterica subsp. arizonae TaxID=59203 RepID=A0A379TJW1_SALER|nr:magnesium-transporting ATPase MgtA [Salmonella enterica subsp. arizonae]